MYFIKFAIMELYDEQAGVIGARKTKNQKKSNFTHILGRN